MELSKNLKKLEQVISDLSAKAKDISQPNEETPKKSACQHLAPILASETLKLPYPLSTESSQVADGESYEVCLELMHPEDGEKVMQAVSQTPNENLGQPIEFRIVAPDSSIRWMEGNGKIFYDEVGKIVRMRGIVREITNRQQVENSLEAFATKKLRVAQAIASTSDGILITDANQADNPIIYSNPAFSRITGYEPEEVLGRNCRFLQGVDTDPEAIAQIREAINCRQEIEVTLLNYRKEGQPFWNELKISPVFADDGELLYFVGIQTDITQRKQAEEALKQREQSFRFLAELIPQQVWTAQPDGTLDYVNPRVLEYFGRTFAEMIGWGWQQVIHPEDLGQCLERWRYSLTTGEQYEVEFRLLRSADQTYRWHIGRASPLYNDAGKIISWFGTNTDIDDRKQAEVERLQLLKREQASRNQITNILESITDAFLALDRDWRFTYLNSRAEQLLFRTKDELISRCIWDEFPELLGSTFDHEYHRAVAQQVTVHFEEFYPELETWFEVRAYPYQEGLSVYFRDVTVRKQAEASLLERSRLSTLEAHLGIALGQGGSLSESLKQCSEAMVEHLHAVFAGIWTFNQETNFLELEALAGEAEFSSWVTGHEAQASQKQVSLEGSIIGFVAQSRQPYLTQDSSKRFKGGFEIRLYDSQIAESCLLLTNSYFAGYPLIIEDRLIGVIAVVKDEPFSEAVNELLGWVANAVSVAIDRFWAREALSARREALLFQLASQIRKSLDLDTILGTAVTEIRSLLQVDRCQYLWYFSQGAQTNLMVTHESSADASLPSSLAACSPQKLSPLVEKIRHLIPLQVDNVSKDTSIDEETKALLSNLGITSALLLPLETPHAHQRGAIVCTHYQGHRPWSKSEVELLQAVVDQLAIAIDQAEVYAQSRAAAFAAQTQATQLEHALQELKQTESRLIQTEKMSSLGQMVAGIAHEINNPVNFINGNLTHTSDYVRDLLDLIQLYQQHYPNPHPDIADQTEEVDLDFLADDLPKMLSSMQAGADRIRQIVLSLRNFSRLDEAEKKPVDIHEGIDSTLMIVHNRLKPLSSNITIEVIKEYGQLPLVECYAGQLNQVFMNIINNAIDALHDWTEERLKLQETQPHLQSLTPCIRIRTEMNADNTGVVIRIADNGPGMTPEVLKQLFDPFFTTKPVGKGTGLGLSISYQIIVEKHGGVLKCVSEPGQGAEFWIEIPNQQN